MWEAWNSAEEIATSLPIQVSVLNILVRILQTYLVFLIFFILLFCLEDTDVKDPGHLVDQCKDEVPLADNDKTDPNRNRKHRVHHSLANEVNDYAHNETKASPYIDAVEGGELLLRNMGQLDADRLVYNDEAEDEQVEHVPNTIVGLECPVIRDLRGHRDRSALKRNFADVPAIPP